MKSPAQFAQAAEERPVLPPGDCERVSGYGIMGLPFASGHVLGLRRWTASSVGDRFTSIWHRDPTGRWTFYESVACDVACHRYFGADVERVQEGLIDLEWEATNRLRVRTVDGAVDWEIAIGATIATRMMSVMGSMMPLAVWRSKPVLSAMGAGRGAGTRRRESSAHWNHVQPTALRRQSSSDLVRDCEPCCRRRRSSRTDRPLGRTGSHG